MLISAEADRRGADALNVTVPNAAELAIINLVKRAAVGDASAWKSLIDKYGRLVWSITREYRLVESDAADVFQTTWMRLLEHIGRLQHPERVGSWLTVTARNECLRNLAFRKRIVLVPEGVTFDVPAEHAPEVDAALLTEESVATVREAVAQLPMQWQRLMMLLMADPPASYAEISYELGLPVGSIGPTRARCLAKLRVLLAAS